MELSFLGTQQIQRETLKIKTNFSRKAMTPLPQINRIEIDWISPKYYALYILDKACAKTLLVNVGKSSKKYGSILYVFW